MNKQDIAARRAVSAVGPNIRTQGKSGQTIGGVSQNIGGGRMDLGVAEPFGFTHTSAAAETVKVGDPTGAVAAAGSKTITAYTSGTKFTNAILNDLLRNPVAISTINYEVAAASDFNDSMEYAAINIGGAYASKPLNSVFTMSKRNTQQNSLLLTGEWPEGIVLGPTSCLFQLVDTTTVTMSFQPRDLFEI